MMDLLDRILKPGTDLLDHVDDVLVRCGAPDEHPIWRHLTRLSVLPSIALAQVASLEPESMRLLAARLAETADGVRGMVDSVPAGVSSRGLVADGFTVAWQGLTTQIAAGSDRPCLADRIAATASQSSDLADWAATARRNLAGEIGACLGSSEAVILRAVRMAAGGPDDAAIRAAADIGACVLASVSRSVDDGWQTFRQWSGADAETRLVPLATVDSLSIGHIELH